MKSRTLARALLAIAFVLPGAAVAATPAPHRTPVAVPTPRLPTVALHTEFVVRVNKKGQVVNVKSGKSCPNRTFNAQTYGNVLQMWIRHPDGSAQVGLYKVTYDYDPSTKRVRRNISLLQIGGNWGDQQGAADQMIDLANKESAKQQSQPKANLPPLDLIVGTPSPHP